MLQFHPSGLSNRPVSRQGAEKDQEGQTFTLPPRFAQMLLGSGFSTSHVVGLRSVVELRSASCTLLQLRGGLETTHCLLLQVCFSGSGELRWADGCQCWENQTKGCLLREAGQAELLVPGCRDLYRE